MDSKEKILASLKRQDEVEKRKALNLAVFYHGFAARYPEYREEALEIARALAKGHT